MREMDIICSGTGPSFFSILGVARALQRTSDHIKVRRVACTSGSSIPMVLSVANDVDWFQVYDALVRKNFKSYLRARPWRGGLYDTTPVEHLIDELCGHKKMRDLPIENFAVNTVDIVNKRMHVVSKETEPEMNVGKAIRMTIGIPVLFAPVPYKGKWFLDGGLMQNAMLDIWDDHPREKLIFMEQDVKQETVREIWESDLPKPKLGTIVANSISCLMKSRMDIHESKIASNKRIVRININDTNNLNPSYEKKTELFEEGYNIARDVLDKIINGDNNEKSQTMDS